MTLSSWANKHDEAEGTSGFKYVADIVSTTLETEEDGDAYTSTDGKNYSHCGFRRISQYYNHRKLNLKYLKLMLRLMGVLLYNKVLVKRSEGS